MKKVSAILLSAFLILTFWGCTTYTENDNVVPDATYPPVIEGERTNGTIQSSEEIIANGSYVGLIDNNSFEVIVDYEPTAFRRENSPSFIDDANICEGDIVTITYTRNLFGQNNALSIKLNTERTISNLFPLDKGVYKKYKGTGNEFAEYETMVEFVEDNQIQIKTENPGTNTVNVYEVTDDYVKKVYTESEVYDVINFIGQYNTEEIMLLEPIEVGTTWDLDNDTKRTITAVDKLINTPYSQFKAVEVKTENQFSILYDYYVPYIGHVMNTFEDKETKAQVKSELMTLEKRKKVGK